MPPKKQAASKSRNQLDSIEYIPIFRNVLNTIQLNALSSAKDLFRDFIKEINENNDRPLVQNVFEEHMQQISKDLESNCEYGYPSISANVKEEVMDTIDENRYEQETAESCSSKTPRTVRTRTPQNLEEATDEEMEDLVIPMTAKKMQQMSITRTTAYKSPMKTPRKNVHMPKHSTPKISAKSAPKMDFHDKLQHADDLRKIQQEQKTLRLKQQREERERAARERREAMEREEREKHEMRRKKELLAQQVNAANMRTPPRSPSRKILPRLAKTPSASSKDATPGRRPAKFGKLEVFGNESKPTPTVSISPSRDRKRSIKREKLTMVRPPTPDETKRLRAEQEAYLLNLQNHVQDNQEEKQEKERKELEKERKEREKEKEVKRLLEEQKRIAREENERQIREEENRKLRQKKAEELERKKQEELQRIELQAQKEKEALQAEMAKKAKNLPASYEMTPPRVYTTNSADDYGLHDLNSDDETDNEDEPRKKIPAWADFGKVRAAVREHFLNPPFDVNEFFGEIPISELKIIFGETVRLKKRGSSAVWKTPMNKIKTVEEFNEEFFKGIAVPLTRDYSRLSSSPSRDCEHDDDYFKRFNPPVECDTPMKMKLYPVKPEENESLTNTNENLAGSASSSIHNSDEIITEKPAPVPVAPPRAPLKVVPAATNVEDELIEDLSRLAMFVPKKPEERLSQRRRSEQKKKAEEETKRRSAIVARSATENSTARARSNSVNRNSREPSVTRPATGSRASSMTRKAPVRVEGTGVITRSMAKAISGNTPTAPAPKPPIRRSYMAPIASKTPTSVSGATAASRSRDRTRRSNITAQSADRPKVQSKVGASTPVAPPRRSSSTSKAAPASGARPIAMANRSMTLRMNALQTHKSILESNKAKADPKPSITKPAPAPLATRRAPLRVKPSTPAKTTTSKPIGGSAQRATKAGPTPLRSSSVTGRSENTVTSQKHLSRQEANNLFSRLSTPKSVAPPVRAATKPANTSASLHPRPVPSFIYNVQSNGLPTTGGLHGIRAPSRERSQSAARKQ
ncbi:unnamed protein product [Caenorhabditis bovis]|uniref:Inner centromere protein ARK-binding domain-containing protein n=1 Tax=Caenorhabditis bovis TaxID=2654633 RepID=A0A8S1F725_9PELO|nr:unnamed protein product [Caenorhabditis bovis]